MGVCVVCVFVCVSVCVSMCVCVVCVVGVCVCVSVCLNVCECVSVFVCVFACFVLALGGSRCQLDDLAWLPVAGSMSETGAYYVCACTSVEIDRACTHMHVRA